MINCQHFIIASLVAFGSASASANMKNYAANYEFSQWENSRSTPVQCSLKHDIPRYGQAIFTSRASKLINLDFELDMKRLPAKAEMASLRSVPPNWKPGSAAQDLADVKLYRQFTGYVSEQPAWRMLDSLDSGDYPTFYFRDWYRGGEFISVGLSSVNFQNKYQEFLECVSNLLPYSLDDIAYSVLDFNVASDELTQQSQQRLAMISEFLRYSPDINVVVVDSYTGSYGDELQNLQTSSLRAENIKQYFLDNGLKNLEIKTNGYGEKSQIASNSNIIERQKNQRVVISLGQPIL
ncbi:flagellar protein MotY [Moritella viscosa]|uniref:Sodium-type flagellar protein MotY n=1 Tax=Moritella viscosa TaxID=80854 RepID=A0A090IF65_9GAMM|nr:OmpA family protein [Moritella viscosa]CED60776.1 component of sodium-driven polar flagellar motor [Moritella viscosa]SGY96450.1 Sodium-type flagellar protein MotY [Moritella viscosa]SGZ02591.1 Sodium-type flagellar protein MotY [Moritella viscosa]SGZ09023.1 Sodium-type flagellar protein MotY [Moritella viscosa]SGZ09104.1 Sodium-type flagellar protein MotY [Moritella viscosa]